MNKKLYIFILSVIIASSSNAQLLLNQPNEIVPNNLNGNLNYNNISMFSGERFDMQHGFNMSMTYLGNQPISILGYSNKLTYYISNNLKINANILLYQTSLNNHNPNNEINNSTEIAYDAGLIFKPTKNSFLELRIQNAPNYLGMNNTYNNNFFQNNKFQNPGLNNY